MQQETFERYKHLIGKESGIHLGDEKKSLLQNRIRKRMLEVQASSEEEYLSIIESDLSGNELIALLNVISTNHTFFFREIEHFTFLEENLHERKTGEEVKVWCAASSSGQEPYSLAITLDKVLSPKHIPYRILCTDICTEVLTEATIGKYPENQCAGIDRKTLDMYFTKQTSSKETYYTASKKLKTNMLFKRLNLNKFPYPLKGGFDYIFCRNVMIYFQDELQHRIVNHFHSLLRPGGYLIVGMSESIARLPHQYASLGKSIYQKEIA